MMPSVMPSAAMPIGERRCWKVRYCEKYYKCGDSMVFHDADALPDETDLDFLHYWNTAARWHDQGQEWQWLARLHASGLVRWRGAIDPRAPSSDPCWRRRPECWRPLEPRAVAR